jgi:hypothetical protein
MPVTSSSPINRPLRRPERGLGPGSRSHPSAKRDSVPEQKPAGSASTVKAHGETPVPSLPIEGRSDAINGVVANHLVRHRLLTLPRGE